MKIVLDTNVIVSGLLFPGGPPDRIVKKFLTGQVINATSPDLLTELKEVLSRNKFGLDPTDVETHVNLIASNSQLVYPQERFHIIKADEQDNRILECACEADAEYIISGDKRHLIPLKTFRGISIFAPADYLIRFP